MKDRLYLERNWGNKPIETIIMEMERDFSDILEIAYELNLHLVETANIRRTWTKEEEEFIKKYAKQLSIKEVSNLLYRSYYAVYQRVRFLGLENEMIKQRK